MASARKGQIVSTNMRSLEEKAQIEAEPTLRRKTSPRSPVSSTKSAVAPKELIAGSRIASQLPQRKVTSREHPLPLSAEGARVGRRRATSRQRVVFWLQGLIKKPPARASPTPTPRQNTPQPPARASPLPPTAGNTKLRKAF